MANISITLEGIDKVISNLNYRPGSIKYKVIKSIRENYNAETSSKTLSFIDTDAIIRSIWNVDDDPSKIRFKHKNYYSLKSSINKDLKRLIKRELNPENIYISEFNIFDMAKEAENQLFNSFLDDLIVGDLSFVQTAGLIKAVSGFLINLDKDQEVSDPDSLIDKIKKASEKLSQSNLDAPSLVSTDVKELSQDGDNLSVQSDTKDDKPSKEKVLTDKRETLSEEIYLQVKELPKNLQSELLNTIRAWQNGKNRKFQRKKITSEIDVLINNHVIQTNMIDISANGVLMQTREHIEADKNVKMVFSLPGIEKPFKLEGRVVRSTENGVAVRFNEISPYFTSILNEAIWGEQDSETADLHK